VVDREDAPVAPIERARITLEASVQVRKRELARWRGEKDRGADLVDLMQRRAHAMTEKY
jgi:hypothetical protein